MNYIEEAKKTELIGQFYPLPAVMVVRILQEQLAHAKELDALKKAIIYGKSIGNLDPKLKQFDHMAFDLTEQEQRIFHSILGIMTEAHELLEALMEMIETGKVDMINLREEYGDLMWYQAIGLDAIGSDFEEAGRINIAKLAARYPEKFSEERALNRDLKKERAILET